MPVPTITPVLPADAAVVAKTGAFRKESLAAAITRLIISKLCLDEIFSQASFVE